MESRVKSVGVEEILSGGIFRAHRAPCLCLFGEEFRPAIDSFPQRNANSLALCTRFQLLSTNLETATRREISINFGVQFIASFHRFIMNHVER